jgi:hypothetical protein
VVLVLQHHRRGRAVLVVAAITGGAAPSDDAAVVELARSGALVCSGTVIAPRAILTAAHCASAGVTDATSGAVTATVIGWRVDPDFDPATLAHDVAIAIVDPPITTIAPAALAADPDGLAVGGLVRVVGFGLASAGDTQAPARRSGTSQIGALTADAIATVAAPSQTCEGDSGGPAFAGAVVVGVASSGDAACTGGASHARIAAHRAFVDAAAARVADGAAAAGERCADDANCAAGAGPCVPGVDEPRWSYCTPACGSGGACPDGLVCAGGACRHDGPSPGAMGASCASGADCASGICLAPAGATARVCTDACFPDLPGLCPSGLACAAADDGGDACFAPAPPGGCSATRAPGPLLVIVIVAARRRRATSR